MNPVIIDDKDHIIAGHGRVEAAKKLGMKEVPCLLASHLTPAQKRAYMLADNRMALDAGWDDDLLAIELKDLAADGFDLSLTGFEADEINQWLNDPAPGLTDEDQVPDVVSDPVSRSGDIWILGSHRLMCGDSTDKAAVTALMDGGRADMVFTDPPYGVAYVGKTKDALKIKNDSLDERKLESFIRSAFTAGAAVCSDGAVWYVAAPAGPIHHVFATVLKEMGIWRQTLNWVKNTFALGRSDFHYRHEPIFYGWLPNGSHFFSGDRTLDTVWEFDKPSRNAEHPTMKPVALVERAIINSSRDGQSVLDLFGGSGSTLIAAEKTGRIARLMELDPIYVDVIIKRWQEFTGRMATIEGTEKSFADVEAERN